MEGKYSSRLAEEEARVESSLLPHSWLSSSSRRLEGDDGGHYDAVAAATLP